MKKMLVLLFVAAFVAGSAFVAVANNGPPEIKLEAKMGTVTFTHEAHQGRNIDCKTCHHTGDYATCKSCHDAKPEAPKSKDAYHKLCKDCHKTAGPTKCKECHVK